MDLCLQQRIANRDQQMLVIELEDLFTVRVFLRVISCRFNPPTA
jgi:hypothetical protein